MAEDDPRYVLITAVRNEEMFIEETIRAVLSQTILPVRWVVVSNNSTDRTDRILSDHARQNPVIHHMAISFDGPRDFRAKVMAFRRGYEAVRSLPWDFVGNLDGDVSFPPRFMEDLLAEFDRRPRLGIGGGGSEERFATTRHVSGNCQVFRRKCYEEIGGYVPLKEGGEDTAADIMARMRGWDAASFPRLLLTHNRRGGTATGSIFRSRFRDGMVDYVLGKPPLAVAVKTLRRLFERPYLVGTFCRLSGFLSAARRGEERLLPQEFVRFVRAEELRRLVSWFPGMKSEHRAS